MSLNTGKLKLIFVAYLQGGGGSKKAPSPLETAYARLNFR